MLNHTGITSKKYGNMNQILFAIEHQVSVGIQVSDAAYVTENGKKVVKAGTPLTGDLRKRTTPFTVASAGSTTAASNAVGVLLHDVDVTDGVENGTLLIFGFVNVDMIDTATRAKITDYVEEALNMIRFISLEDEV